MGKNGRETSSQSKSEYSLSSKEKREEAKWIARLRCHGCVFFFQNTAQLNTAISHHVTTPTLPANVTRRRHRPPPRSGKNSTIQFHRTNAVGPHVEKHVALIVGPNTASSDNQGHGRSASRRSVHHLPLRCSTRESQPSIYFNFDFSFQCHGFATCTWNVSCNHVLPIGKALCRSYETANGSFAKYESGGNIGSVAVTL